jgi:hypothetical protein
MAFRRQPVPQQVAQRHQAMTVPAPTRGIIESENFSFMQPGAAIICDNWAPTMRGVKLRGGHIRWCVLPDPLPVLSSFEYASGNVQYMFAAQQTKLYDVTAATPVLVKGGQLSGNYSAAQLATAAGDFLTAVNDAGDPPLRFNGATWITITDITGGPPGQHLVYVWKYRNRLFFIGLNSMDAWYLGIDSIGGALQKIPLSGAATKGGKLLFGASWSIDAGDGIDDKCVFATDQGELLIFTGSNPSDPNNWRQEGRYQIPPPMGINAHIALGGDLLIATVDGIVPVSAAITKDAEQLDLAMISHNIRSLWRTEAIAKRTWQWTMKRWDEYGGMFVTWPGGTPGSQYCAIVNTGTGAWARFTGWDATCFIRLRGDMFFGTQGGVIMQADRTGYDDGLPYVASLLGGWGMFGQQAQTKTWSQARASFAARAGEPFQPQLGSCVDFVIAMPQPPSPGVDPGILDVWDQGKWGPDLGGPPPPVPTPPQRAAYAQWDQPAAGKPVVRNTGWVSIGSTGYSHALTVQVTVAQQAKPDVELIAIDALFWPVGTDV